MIYLVNQDDPHAKTLAEKLSEEKKPGSIIPLTQGEMELYNSNDFQVLAHAENNGLLAEVEKGKRYVMVVNPDYTNIDDILRISEILQVNIGIIRKRGS